MSTLLMASQYPITKKTAFCLNLTRFRCSLSILLDRADMLSMRSHDGVCLPLQTIQEDQREDEI